MIIKLSLTWFNIPLSYSDTINQWEIISNNWSYWNSVDYIRVNDYVSVQNCRARTDDQKPNLVAASCFKTMFDPNLMMAQGARSININKNMPAKRNFSFWWFLPWHWSPNSAHITWDLIWIDQYNIDFQFLKTIKLYSVQVQK